MKRTALNVALALVVIALLAGSMTGCETLKSLLAVEKPEVSIESVDLTALSFDGAEVTAELAIANPNPMGISMSGFSYELLIEENRFVSGDIDESIQIAPNGTSPLSVPVAVGFQELVETVREVRDQDETAYRINLELRFELPILGEISVPVTAEGVFPVVRLPQIRLASVRLDSISLAGARLELEVAVDNPNAFGLSVAGLDYDFTVAGVPWVTGSAPRGQSVEAGRESIFVLPFTLQFSSVGRTVRDVLLGRDSLRYELSVLATVGTDLPLIRTVDLPYDLAGNIDLRR